MPNTNMSAKEELEVAFEYGSVWVREVAFKYPAAALQYFSDTLIREMPELFRELTMMRPRITMFYLKNILKDMPDLFRELVFLDPVGAMEYCQGMLKEDRELFKELAFTFPGLAKRYCKGLLEDSI